VKVYLGIGSNIAPADSIALGLQALRDEFGAMQASSVYESDSVGFNGPRFWNLVVALDTDLELLDLQDRLRAIEFQHGRPKNAVRNSSRALDIDILLYGDYCGFYEQIELPRPEIHYNAFVLRPLSELAPDRALPNINISLNELWQRFDQAKQPVVRIPYVFLGLELPGTI
jgi:2-amino-4-hydroxy-6-hydroxymethyldihydropteridine diphosphokinase